MGIFIFMFTDEEAEVQRGYVTQLMSKPQGTHSGNLLLTTCEVKHFKGHIWKILLIRLIGFLGF